MLGRELERGGNEYMDKTNVVKIIAVSAVIFLSLIIASLILNVVKLAGLSRREAELKNELYVLEQAMAENSETLEFMQTDDYVDQYAREYLNLIGKDELPFTAK
jgi:cell division protein FtsB